MRQRPLFPIGWNRPVCRIHQRLNAKAIFSAAMIDWEQGGVLNPLLFLPRKFSRLIGSPAIYFSNNSSLFSVTASHASMSVFSSRTISGDSDTVCDDNISGELIPNRLNHALQINASLVDLVDKDNGGNVHFPRGMEQNTGLGLHAIFSGDHQDGPI